MERNATCCCGRAAVPSVPYAELHARLGFDEHLSLPGETLATPLSQWQADSDDPIVRYLLRNQRPQRHLEFGTLEGGGVLRCLEECDATVWTINLVDGELTPDGRWAYTGRRDRADTPPPVKETRVTNAWIWYRTDAFGSIGRRYLEAKMGHRVCQVYCDSRDWDITNYPRGFFDTAMIDGGHSPEVVISDTRTAFELVRPRGLILWHDFCSDPEAQKQCGSVRAVVTAIESELTWIAKHVSDLFWIEPSWILLGVRR